jgi:hypothetical protein
LTECAPNPDRAGPIFLARSPRAGRSPSQGDNDLVNLLVAFHEPMRINDLVKGKRFGDDGL